jgi:hypothetical protein
VRILAAHGSGLLPVLLGVLWAGLLFGGSAVRSQTPGQGAAQHLAKARDLYQAGNYAVAITELKAAYSLNPLPRILCNLAKAYRKNGQAREAAEHFDLCLRTDPQLSPQERAEFTAQLEQLRAALEPPPPPRPDPSSQGPQQGPSPPPPMTTTTTTSQPGPGVQADPVPAVGPPTAEPVRPIYKRAWFWGVVGGVAAVGIIATVAGVAAARSQAPTVVEPELPMGVPVFAWQ